MRPEPYVTAAVLAASIASVSVIIALAEISRPLKLWTARYSRFVTELLSCPVCTEVWLALGATAIYRPWLVNTWRPTDFLVTWFAIVTAAAVMAYPVKKILPTTSAVPSRPVKSEVR